MAKGTVKRRDEPTGLVIAYVRLDPEDHAELRRRMETTGSPIAAQVRLLVHAALEAQRRKKVIL